MRARRSGMIRTPGWQALMVAAATGIASVIGAATPAAAHASAGAAHAPRHRPSAANPTVTGPVTGGKGAIVLATTAFDLPSVGYTQSEFFISCNASSYAPTAPLGSDGEWRGWAPPPPPPPPHLRTSTPPPPA